MPIYHFNVFNEAEGTSADWSETDLPDVETAKREAIRLAGAMIADSASTKRSAEVWHVEVTDHTGATLLNLNFTVRSAPTRLARGLSSTP